MSATVRHEGGVRILKIDGEFSGPRVETFMALARQEFAADARDFVVDLSDVTGVNSAGLEALTWLKREAEERLGLLKLCSAPETVQKILELTRLDRHLDACEFLEEALAGFA